VRIRTGFEPFFVIRVAPALFIQNDVQGEQGLSLLSPSTERLKSGASKLVGLSRARRDFRPTAHFALSQIRHASWPPDFDPWFPLLELLELRNADLFFE
jgi:hypothetical protein